MLHVYGPYMPIRTLEEIVFWKTQEREHTVVIRALANIEATYADALHQWEAAFTQTENYARQLLEAALHSTQAPSPWLQQNIQQLVFHSIEQSKHFIRLLETLMKQSKVVAANPTAQVVILHIMRESDYFLGILYSSENNSVSQ
jgi:Fe-Mn family superoxide dismutase